MIATLKHQTNKHNHTTTPFPQKTRTSISPLDIEINLDPGKYLLSKTDASGFIEYCNEQFTNICGYRESELISQPHSIVRHPDMPAVIFQLMWDHLHRRKKITLILKNLSKHGHYYWVQTDINIKINKASNEVIGYFAYQKKVPQHVLKKIKPLYEKLLEIEKASGMEASMKYFKGFLEDRGEDYDTYIEDITRRNIFTKKLSKLKQKLFISERETISLTS